MKVKTFLLLLFAWAGIAYSAFSQQSGSIYGKVKDAANGDFLPGAAIYLEGMKFATISDAEGNFSLSGVSARDYLVISDDFFPTFAELLGEESPGELDGKSLLPLWKGEGHLQRNTLYFHFPHYHHQGYLPAGAVREGDYKLIEWFEESIYGEGHAYDLYNLVEDPGEENDLSGEMPDMVEEMVAKLKKWRKGTGAQEMGINDHYEPDRADWREADSRDADN